MCSAHRVRQVWRPLHPETRPSFYVNVAKKLFYCHSCGRASANPAIAPQVSQHTVYPGARNLPEHLAALAAEKSDIAEALELPGVMTKGYAMKALATLSGVSDDALKLFQSFLNQQYPMQNEEARIAACISSIAHLIETRERAPEQS